MALKRVEDVERSDGHRRRLLFDDDELAVIDISSDVLTVNWTTQRSAAQFVSDAVRLQDYETADAIVCTPKTEEELDFRGLTWLASRPKPSVAAEWNLVRLDVSDTRSVAWERLPGGTLVVGFGDDAECLHGNPNSEASQRLLQLVHMTCTPHIDFHSVVDNAVQLAKLWHDRANAGPADKKRRTAATDTTAAASETRDRNGYQTGF